MYDDDWRRRETIQDDDDDDYNDELDFKNVDLRNLRSIDFDES